jgi:hypothetical protein
VTFQQKFDGEGLRAERTLEQSHRWLFDGRYFRSVGNHDVSIELRFGAEHGRSLIRDRATRTTEELRFAAVLNGHMNLDRDFGVECFLAKSATVKMMSVHVQQVFLEFIRRWEALDARRATVLVPA